MDLTCNVSGFSIFLFWVFLLNSFLACFLFDQFYLYGRVVDNGVPAVIPGTRGTSCLSDLVPKPEEGSHWPGLSG